MARRGDLAGLAALGALGYALTRGGKKAQVEERSSRFVPDEAPAASNRMLYPDESSNTGGDYAPAAPREMRPAAPVRAPAAAPAMMSQEEMTRRRLAGGPRGRTDSTLTRVAGQGGPRGTRYSATDTGDETDRLARRYPAAPRQMTREEAISRIPTAMEGYTPSDRPRVTGNELTRNIMNTLNATAGLSAPGVVGKETMKQFAARAAARRAEEGLSEAEVADFLRRKALSEMDVMGGAVGYKKGGKVKAKAKPVKKMASGGMAKSSASKRADGIATKGKTKCKMY